MYNTMAQHFIHQSESFFKRKEPNMFISNIQAYRREKGILQLWGLHSIERERATMNVRIDEQMKKAKHQYDLIAFGLKSLRKDNSEGVTACLKRGVMIRIISVDPESLLLSLRDEQENKVQGSTAHSIWQLQSWVDELNQQFPGRISVKHSRYLPSEFYCRVDDSIFVGPYQYGKESQQTITYEYRRPGKGFSLYEAYYDALWHDEQYCF